jgi:hypothetical protein
MAVCSGDPKRIEPGIWPTIRKNIDPLPFIPSHQPFDVLKVPRKIEGGRGWKLLASLRERISVRRCARFSEKRQGEEDGRSMESAAEIP